MKANENILTNNEVIDYFEAETGDKVISAEIAHTFDDSGNVVRFWDVKSKNLSAWVVEGDNSPMDLYKKSDDSIEGIYKFYIELTNQINESSSDDQKVTKEFFVNKKVKDLRPNKTYIVCDRIKENGESEYDTYPIFLTRVGPKSIYTELVIRVCQCCVEELISKIYSRKYFGLKFSYCNQLDDGNFILVYSKLLLQVQDISKIIKDIEGIYKYAIKRFNKSH